MLNAVLLFLNIGTPEMLLIVGAILLLFGGKKMPELARGLGKGIREFKDINAVNDDLDVDFNSKNSNVNKQAGQADSNS